MRTWWTQCWDRAPRACASWKRPELDGFFLSVDKTGAALRLHPLVKAHCLNRLALEDPARKQALQTRIARALERPISV